MVLSSSFVVGCWQHQQHQQVVGVVVVLWNDDDDDDDDDDDADDDDDEECEDDLYWGCCRPRPRGEAPQHRVGVLSQSVEVDVRFVTRGPATPSVMGFLVGIVPLNFGSDSSSIACLAVS